MDRNPEHYTQLVALSTASAIVYRDIMGSAIEQMSVADLNRILHEVARAISNVAVIYGKTAQMEVSRPVAAFDLMHGVFQRGATILRTPGGTEYRELAIRRGDMRLAIAVLRRSGTRF